MPNPNWFPKPPQPKPLPLGLVVLFLIIGVACLSWGVHDLYLAEASQRWPTVPGTILAADTGETTSKSYDRERRGNKTRTRTSYAPSVSYQYQVEGAQFQGDRIFIGEGFHMGRAAADTLLARYPVRQQVTVHYHARHPERSVLEPGIRARNWSAAIVGVIFISIGWPSFARLLRPASPAPDP